MPLLRRLPEAYRARIQNAAADMIRLHGDEACEIARKAAKKARTKHLATARYWSLVAAAILRNDTLDLTVSPSVLPRVADMIDRKDIEV